MKFTGRHIVVDPKICHGKSTFRGTHILVADVLKQVSEGLAQETIIEEWHAVGITEEVIAKVVVLTGKAFLEHIDEYV